MSDLPLVSVIIPAYNDEKYIKSSIESVLAQPYPNIEVIVVDDGSTDNTASIVQSFANIKYVKQKNKGSAVARNLGVSLAKGKFIAFNDADDLWAPNRLAQQVQFMEANPSYQATCGVDIAVKESFSIEAADVPSVTYPPQLIKETSGWHYLTLLKTIPYHIINLMVTRELAQTLAFDPILKRGQDYDYWINISQKTPIAHIDQIYGYYRQTPNSNTRKPHTINYKLLLINKAISNYGVTEKNGRKLSHKELNDIYYQIHFCHGFELFRKKLYKHAIPAFICALKQKALKKGPYKYILLSMIKLMLH